MKKIKNYLFRNTGVLSAAFGIGISLYATVAGAQQTQTLPTNLISTPQAVTAIFCNILLWMFWGLIVLGIAMFLVGGYTYATSAGDTEKVSKATKTLTYAAIALVVGLIARGIPTLIGSFIGAGGVTVC